MDDSMDEQAYNYSPPALPMSLFPTAYNVKNPDNTRCVTLKTSQLQPKVLSKIFGYFPDTIFLLSENGQVYTPENEEFSYIVENELTCFGETLSPPIDGSFKYCYQPPDTSMSSIPSTSKGKGRKFSKSNCIFKKPRPPGVEKQQDLLQWTKTIEILKLNNETKVFEKVINLPVRLNENTANIKDVANLVSNDIFHGKEVELIDLDFLKIVDLPSTQGTLCV